MKKKYKARLRYRIHKRWSVAALSGFDIKLLTYFLAFQAAVRGLDYATGYEDERNSPTLSAVESAFKLEYWGAVFMVGAFILTAGALFKRHFFVWLGHSLLALFYLALAIGIFSSVSLTDGWDNIRSVNCWFAHVVRRLIRCHTTVSTNEELRW